MKARPLRWVFPASFLVLLGTCLLDRTGTGSGLPISDGGGGSGGSGGGSGGATCGNGYPEPGEDCDPTLNGETCASQGFPGGILACDPKRVAAAFRDADLYSPRQRNAIP